MLKNTREGSGGAGRGGKKEEEEEKACRTFRWTFTAQVR